MPDQGRRSPARLIAPVALVVCALAFFLVLSDSSVEDGEGNAGGAATSGERSTPTTDTAPKRRRTPATYTVKVGDSLGAIAVKTGVDVEALEELNPEVDAQALSPGQKLKLRE